MARTWFERFCVSFLFLLFVFGTFGVAYAQESVSDPHKYAFNETERPDITKLVPAGEESIEIADSSGQIVQYGKLEYWYLPENADDGGLADAMTVSLFGHDGVYIYRWKIIKDGVTIPNSTFIFDFNWYAAFADGPVYKEDPRYVTDNFLFKVYAVVSGANRIKVFATITFVVLGAEGNSIKLEHEVESTVSVQQGSTL